MTKFDNSAIIWKAICITLCHRNEWDVIPNYSLDSRLRKCLFNAGVPKKCSSESTVLFLDAFLLPLRMVMHLSLNHLKWEVLPVSLRALLVSVMHYCGAQVSPLVAVLGATAVVFNCLVNQDPQTYKGPESRYFRLCRPYSLSQIPNLPF